VQDVDKWDADVAAWLERFDFLPRWRIDDIMVSFAAPQGSVGAHVDQYDVFLIQGMGQRRWLIDTRPDSSRGFRTDVELRLLREFTPGHDWVLEPGDMLYLPPGIPHHGIALDAGLTLSVGMRAPSHGELLGDLADSLAQALPEEARFSDPDLTLQASDGRIDAAVLRRVRKALQSITQVGDTRLADWFGEFITCYRSAAQPAAPPHPPTAARIEKTLLAGGRLQPHPLTRCAWREQDGCAIVHINGERFRASRKLARQLARRQSLGADDYAGLDADDRALVQHLARSGLLALPAD
jgi:50S ribosomal protein L16 3-hydroxylase